jgi:hypothetical protein
MVNDTVANATQVRHERQGKLTERTGHPGARHIIEHGRALREQALLDMLTLSNPSAAYAPTSRALGGPAP